MNKNNLTQVIQLAGLLHNDYNSYGQVELYMKLLHLAKRLTTIDTQSCNGTRNEESYQKAWESVNNKLAEVLTPYKLNWYHQSDPRGASLYISKVKVTSENYNQLAIAIY